MRTGRFNLNDAQKAAAECPIGPLLIVAGAGTGKTTTLTARLIHLIDQGIPPEKICAITFTNKAANEMFARVHAHFPRLRKRMRIVSDEKSPFIGTFHSLGAKILRAECEVLGRKKNFAIFDDHDGFDLIKKICKRRLKERGKNISAPFKKLLESPSFFGNKISSLKNTEHARAALERSTKAEDIYVSQIFEAYEQELKKNNAFDFDDLIEKSVKLFADHPRVREKYERVFDAILVDEYQDINPKQYALIRALAGAHKNVSMVGDDEQMIYGWRYATLETFLSFEEEWPGAHVAFLEENYRSTRTIINSAATLSQHNIRRRPKNLWTKNPEGTAIKVFEAENEIIEAAWIGRTAHELRDTDPKTSIAVIYRTNAQSRALEQALIREGLPYIIFGGIKFYERKEVKDAVAALRYVSNAADSVSRERIEKNLSKARFAGFVEALRGVKTLSPLKVLEVFLESTEYFPYLERNFTNFAEREENIAELISFAGRFETLEELLEEISLVQSTDTPSGQKDEENKGAEPVQLMTIHLAKGLEFDAVFIAGCREGTLPHGRSMDTEDEIEEERRLMYVAMTRAKKNLFVSFYDLPSRFIGELPPEFLEFENFLSREESGGWEEESVSI